MLVFWFELDLTIFCTYIQMVCIFKLTLNNDRKVTPPPFIYGFAQDFIQFECLFVRELSSNPFLQYWFVEIFENIPTYYNNTFAYYYVICYGGSRHILYNQISNSCLYKALNEINVQQKDITEHKVIFSNPN